MFSRRCPTRWNSLSCITTIIPKSRSDQGPPPPGAAAGCARSRISPSGVAQSGRQSGEATAPGRASSPQRARAPQSGSDACLPRSREARVWGRPTPRRASRYSKECSGGELGQHHLRGPAPLRVSRSASWWAGFATQGARSVTRRPTNSRTNTRCHARLVAPGQRAAWRRACAAERSPTATLGRGPLGSRTSPQRERDNQANASPPIARSAIKGGTAERSEARGGNPSGGIWGSRGEGRAGADGWGIPPVEHPAVRLTNALPFSCKGRYVMVDSSTAGAARAFTRERRDSR